MADDEQEGPVSASLTRTLRQNWLETTAVAFAVAIVAHSLIVGRWGLFALCATLILIAIVFSRIWERRKEELSVATELEIERDNAAKALEETKSLKSGPHDV